MKISRQKLLELFSLIFSSKQNPKDDFKLNFKEWLIFEFKKLNEKIEPIQDLIRKTIKNFTEDKESYEKAHGLEKTKEKMWQLLFGCITIGLKSDSQEYLDYLNCLKDEKHLKQFEEVEEYVKEEIDIKINKINKVNIPESINIDLLEFLHDFDLIEE